jgi:hypothetical protein
VDLGGPEVTIPVPASGLVAVFARGEIVSGEILLSEPTDISPPVRILARCCARGPRQWTTINNDAGTSDLREASWLLLEATPGTRTYTLKYRVRDTEAGNTARFWDRKLWVVPIR